MAPSNDKDSQSTNNVENEIQEDETDIGRISINVSVEEEDNSTPRIVNGLLNMNGAEIPYNYGELSETEWEVVYECRRLGDWLNDEIEKAFDPIRNINSDRFGQFKRITRRIIANGINWGRIATIFALGAKFLTLGAADLVQEIFYYLVEFARTKLLSWIINSGGWKSIKEYANAVVGNSTQTQRSCTLAVGAILIVGFVYFKFVRE